MAELFDVTGIREMQERLEAMPFLIVQIGGIALQQEAEAVLEKSQQLVPVETSSLRDSGHVEDVTIEGMHVMTGIRYGGTVGKEGRIPEQYAIKIHEDTTLNHPRGGQSHFLSQPLFAEIDGMLERLADAIRLAL